MSAPVSITMFVWMENGENLEILRSEAREMYTVLEEVSKDIKKDSPALSWSRGWKA